jgi:hypothetical protein
MFLTEQGKGLRAGGPLDGQDPVEMVAFVLKELRESPFEKKPALLLSHVAKGDAAAQGPFHPDEQIGKTHAVIPDGHLLPAHSVNPGIDDDEGMPDMNVDEPFLHADLGGCNGAARTAGRPEIHQRIVEIPDEGGKVHAFARGDRIAGFVQRRVSKEKDLSDSHFQAPFPE